MHPQSTINIECVLNKTVLLHVFSTFHLRILRMFTKLSKYNYVRFADREINLQVAYPSYRENEYQSCVEVIFLGLEHLCLTTYIMPL